MEPTKPCYAVDYWYRHETDPDQSTRQYAQMLAGATTGGDIASEIARLRKLGYHVQRAVVYTICPRCHSNARMLAKTYKTRPPKYVDCPSCEGKGRIASIDWPILP